jgi:hypothetical protein
MTRPLRVLRQAAVLWFAVGTLLPSLSRAQGEDEELQEDEPPPKKSAPPAPPPKAPPPPPKSPPPQAAPPEDEEFQEDEEAPPAKPGQRPREPAGESEEGGMPSDAEMEAEMAAENAEGAANLTKPPPKGKGAIVGVIKDTKFAEAIIEGRVQVIGSKRDVFTDTDGRFRLELAPGTYSLRVSYEMHQPTRIDEIKVEEGKLVRIDAELTPDETAVETVTIEESVDRTSLEGQTLQRQRSAAVGDGVGRAEIARTPDRNAAEAAQRVVGATIVGGRFVYVRGLGERYTNALLNGVPLPSPEPDRPTVPLDLFPTLVLDSITINKQFTPEMPGDFAGGSVRINTREFPRQTLFQVSLSGGYNSATTFQNRLGSHGSGTDWLGYDDGTRALPDTIPQKALTAENSSEGERRYWARWMNSWMSAKPRTVPPNHGVSVVAGDSWKVGSSRKIGAIGALSYSRSFQTRDWTIRSYIVRPDESGKDVPAALEEHRGEQTLEAVRVGAFGSLAMELSKADKLVLTGLRSQSADDSASEIEGFNDSANAILRRTRIEYASRVLSVLQFRGAHQLKPLNGAELEWNTSISRAVREQPDTRDVIYRRSGQGQPLRYVWASGPESGAHFFSSQDEDALGAGLDYTQPVSFKEMKLKFGGLLSSREREFTARRFLFEPDGNLSATPPQGFELARICEGAWRSDCPDRLFRRQQIGPGGLILRETTSPLDAYRASLNVLAGYAQLDIEPIKSFRVVGGARAEHTRQQFAGFSPNEPGTTAVQSSMKKTDLLPALSLVLATSAKSNVRLGASRTLARPQLREIAPVVTASNIGPLEYLVRGNPDLEMTRITNLDLRFEVFPTLREVLAASVFYKRFNKPIEALLQASTSGTEINFANAPSANLFGAEIEARKTLDFVSPSLKNFSLLANLTLVYSRIKFEGAFGQSMSGDRPLSMQSPYVVNLSFDYANSDSGTDVRLLYNVFGPRITVVGTGGLPHVYEMPRHSIDLTIAQEVAKHFELKLSGQNLLHQPIEEGYHGVKGYKLQNGELTSGEQNPVVRGYNPGTTISLSATYTY